MEQAPTAGWRGSDGAQPVPGAGHRGAADQLHLHRAEQPRPGQGHAAALRWGHIRILSVIIVIILVTRAALAPGDLLGRAVGQPEQLRAGVEHRERPRHRPVHRPLQEAAGEQIL